MSQSDDIVFFDAEDRVGSKLDFNMILLRQIDRVRSAGSVEFCGGWWNTSRTDQGVSRFYVPDSREVYCNSVLALDDLLINNQDELFLSELQTIEREKEESKQSMISVDAWKVAKITFYRTHYRALLKLAVRRGLFDTPGVAESR